MKRFCLLCVFSASAFGLGEPRYVQETRSPGSFVLAQSKSVAALCVDPSDYAGVIRAVKNLQADIARVTRLTPALVKDPAGTVIIVGTIGKSPLIDRLIRERKIDASEVAGKWESFIIQVVEKP